MRIHRRYTAALAAEEAAGDAVGAYRRAHPETADPARTPDAEELALLAAWRLADDILAEARAAWQATRRYQRRACAGRAGLCCCRWCRDKAAARGWLARCRARWSS